MIGVAWMKRVVASVALSPLETKRLENWSNGFMWPWLGYGKAKTWPLYVLFSISLSLGS